MKCQFCISFLLCCAMWFTACTGPVILEEPKEDMTHNEQNDTIQSPNNDSQIEDSVDIVHEGTYTSPYSIAETQILKRGEELWIEGYIVGCVSGSMKSGCNYTQEATTTSNILLADTFLMGNEDDYLQCLPVELPNSSIEREELNLYDNPKNYHKKIRIQGDITLYYKVMGMKNIAAYIFSDEIELPNEDENQDENQEEEPDSPSEPQEPDETINPDETSTDTLSIAEAISLQSDWEYNQACIRGYIVGYSKGNKSVVYPDSTAIKNDQVTENIVLADNIDTKDNSMVIIVQLPKGYIRDEINLYDNPQNLHKRLTVIGRMTTYNGWAGCKETLGAENKERFLLE